MKKYLKYILIVLIAFVAFFAFYASDSNSSKNTYTPEVKKIIKEEENVVQKLRQEYKNDDIIGTISITDTDINEVIVQASDNKYYLTHDLYKNYDKYGSVFLDHRNNKESKKILIYGHNDYKDKTPFSELENYMHEDYYQKHQFIDLLFDDTKIKYQIFSIYVETSDFTYMNLNIDTNQFQNDLLKYKNNSFYKNDVVVSATDDILILQTCSNDPKYKKYSDKYLLIIAKKIK